MLVIEGADLVGKTTLAKILLQARTPWGPIKYRTLGLLPGSWNYKNDYINMMDHLVVQDRFFLSEWVYGSVCRGATPLTPELMDQLDGHLRNVGGMTVIITADDQVLDKLYEKRGDDLYKLDEIKKVNQEFCKIALEKANTNSKMYCNYHVTADSGFANEDQVFLSTLLSEWYTRLAAWFEDPTPHAREEDDDDALPYHATE